MIRQVQCLATSTDGIQFVKHGAVIETPPQDTIMHFRDPKVWKENGCWYLIVGARLGDTPLLPLYRSTDLHAWEFLDYVASGSEGDGYMWECPDLFRLNGHDVLLYSPQGMQSKVTNGSTSTRRVTEWADSTTSGTSLAGLYRAR